jgi:hypothetical protein
VQTGGRGFSVSAWAEHVRPGFVAAEGALITLGFDGHRYDGAALVATSCELGCQWPLGIWERPDTVADWEAPIDEIDGRVADAFERWNVWRMYANPGADWGSWISAWAGRHGEKKVVEWRTDRRRALGIATRAYAGAIVAGDVSNSGDTRLSSHLGNVYRTDTAMLDEDGRTLWLPRKERGDSPHKIDGALAGVLSWEARNDAIASGAGPPPPSVYEERGVRRL